MAIPETQLETWSRQGSVPQSASTYASIKRVLEAPGVPYAGKDVSVLLQGSYGNDTNIYAESDVDIVICLHDCFHSDLEALSDQEREAYRREFADATYTSREFKRDVLGVLADEYGAHIIPGAKAIAIRPSGNRRKADVIVSIEFRRY